jgi:hypothetical protein
MSTSNHDSDAPDMAVFEKQENETPLEPLPWMNDIPDGGLEAWLVILGNWCINFVTFGWVTSEFIAYIN